MVQVDDSVYHQNIGGECWQERWQRHCHTSQEADGREIAKAELGEDEQP